MLEGRVRFFGYPEVTLSAEEVDVDPLSGFTWPSRHGKRVSYRSAGAADPKWIWELNRCQEIPVLVAAWLVTDDIRYGSAAGDRLRRWVSSHPPGRGIAWGNGFEAAIRAVSMAVAFDGLRGSGLLSDAATMDILRSLWQHARWIERDPSVGSSGNNHRVGELVGLVAIGSLAPELRDSPSWLGRALPELEREAAKQIRGDGTNVEQAFAYHVFVIDLMLVAAALLERTGRPVPQGITAALSRSGDALWAQLGDDEPAPTYGDTDDGRALVMDAEELRDPRGAAAGIAAYLPHGRAARVAGQPDVMSHWLFGSEGARKFACARGAAAPGSVMLADGGLTVIRGQGRRVLVDHGPHGYMRLAAHAHADALSVELSVGSDPLVVDPGVGSYFALPDVRRAFRGTGFHATVVVDGADSSVQGGPFLWTNHAVSRVVAWNADAGILVAEHDGYERLPDPVRHRRAVIAPPGDLVVVVIDRLEGKGAHRYSQRWPLQPTLDVEQTGASAFVAFGPDGGLSVEAAAPAALTLQCIRGQEDPLAGWWSGRLESIEPSWLVSVDVEAVGAVEIVTALVPFGTQAVPDVHLDLEVGDLPCTVWLSVAGETRRVEYDLAMPIPRVDLAATGVA